MSDITLTLNRHDFEYDIFTLVKAFFPFSEIEIADTEEEKKASAICIRLETNEDRIFFSVKKKDAPPLEREESFDPEGERSAVKNSLKRAVYIGLSSFTGKQLPWGDLTGIRPVKIPMKLLDEGWKNADIAEHMRKTYFTDRKKTALAIAIANREKAILDRCDPQNGWSLYIGIPFCPSICLYCSFGSHPLDRFGAYTDAYLKALFKELDYLAGKMKGRTLHTIYIGGGTPTSLSASQLDLLLSYVAGHFDTENLLEYTLEAGRPDTIDEEKLKVIRRYAVTRISINPQTMNDKTLELIGRKHTAQMTRDAFGLARAAGFDNINMDIIVGLPKEGKEEVEYTLDEIGSLRPDSLTVHSLALKRATRLNLFKEEYIPQSFDNSEKIMEMAETKAMQMGLFPYYLYRQKNMAGGLENVGYARENCFGIYNILIMEEKETIAAAGCGGMTKIVYPNNRIERVENVKDLKNYIERIDEMIDRKEKQLSCN